MKDSFIEKKKQDCDKGIHQWSEWRPFDDLEHERHCIYCTQVEYEIIKPL